MTSSEKDWMMKQREAGVTAGLQIVLDVHLEEQFDGTDVPRYTALREQMVSDDADPEFMNVFENGYRYYVHAPNTISYLTSEGVSVSPAMRVYSAISTNSVRYFVIYFA
ncbi:hypothetical protein DICVIV_03880 [Dictyocaulus viviparus]|uniref:Uncharacterized protein n=1 Tax=Dictyocaulus viviparus TaxID=29172 RepID=A0A0D8Y1G9_DICVI|nr:hypothetical protein DICVIV_03880 [Dictyocaulus viviparus]